MKLAKSFKMSTVCHRFTRPIGIPDANAKNNISVRRDYKKQFNKCLKSIELDNNTCSHNKCIRRHDNVIHETAMLQPLLKSGIAINRAQQADRRFIKRQPNVAEFTIISTGRPDIPCPKCRRFCHAAYTSRHNIHKIGECIFSKYLNAPSLIIVNARRTTSIFKNALNLRPCRRARAEESHGPPRGYGVQYRHYPALNVSTSRLVGP